MDRCAAFADAVPLSFWLDDPSAPPPALPLVGQATADLTVVGGGYTGLWTALLAKAADPGRDVVLVEADRCGWAASGRNGGFCGASLTHGLANGVERFPDEIATLERMGRENLDGIEATVSDWSIDCHFERTGEMSVATEPYQVEELRAAGDLAGRHGEPPSFLDTEQVRSEVHSPTFLAGLWDRDACALVNPARLAWGLRTACEEVGVRIFEGTPVDDLGDAGGTGTGPLVVRTTHGQVRTSQVALGTKCLPFTHPSAQALRGARLRLRADDRAVGRRAAGGHRVAAPSGDRRRR